jgi:hypothetical protein
MYHDSDDDDASIGTGAVASSPTLPCEEQGQGADQPKKEPNQGAYQPTDAVPEPAGATVILQSDSESEDVWSRVRVKRTRAAPKKSAGTTFANSIGKAVAAALTAGMAIAASPSALEAACPSAMVDAAAAGAAQKKNGKLADSPNEGRSDKPAGTDKGKPVDPSKEAKAEPDDPPKEAKHTRKSRGTAGTFAGRRPPKDPVKLKLFEAKKDAYMHQQKLAKEGPTGSGAVKTPTMKQHAFWDHMSKCLKGSGGPEGFRAATAEWVNKQQAAESLPDTPGEKPAGVMKKRPAAASLPGVMMKRPAAACLPDTPLKKKPAEEETLTPPKPEKPEKEAASTASSASASVAASSSCGTVASSSSSSSAEQSAKVHSEE